MTAHTSPLATAGSGRRGSLTLHFQPHKAEPRTVWGSQAFNNYLSIDWDEERSQPHVKAEGFETNALSCPEVTEVTPLPSTARLEGTGSRADDAHVTHV